jgi:hypothetical protein
MKAYLEGAAVVGTFFGGGGGELEIDLLAALRECEGACDRRRRSEVVKNRDGPTGCAARGMRMVRIFMGSGTWSWAMPLEKLAIGHTWRLVIRVVALLVSYQSRGAAAWE